MKKGLFFILMTSLLTALVMVSAHSSQEDMVVVKKSLKDPQRCAVEFKHDEHNEKAKAEECNLCHHVYKDGKFMLDESSEDKLCSDCHKQERSGRVPSLMQAYHLNCKGCHEQQNAGPILCGECHKNKK